MKSWQLVDYGAPFEFVEVPDPVPGPGEVTIGVKAAGLCHSDVAISAGQFPHYLDHLPIILGHEIAGVVTGLADNVTEFEVGDRVGVFQSFAGHGKKRDGGYAELASIPVGALIRMPETMSFAQAAIGTDAGMSSYHAVHCVGKVSKGSRLGIIGLGGLGLVGARLGVLAGAAVYAADPNRDTHDAGQRAGITGIVDDVSGFASLNLDVIVDFAGFSNTTAGAIEAVRKGGRVVQVGLGVTEATISTYALASKQVELAGSFGGSASDIEAIYELIAMGELDPPISTISFEEIPEGLGMVERGEVRGRLVAILG